MPQPKTTCGIHAETESQLRSGVSDISGVHVVPFRIICVNVLLDDVEELARLNHC